jgi:uncharacterized protein YdhG (YjbR/CyaY superfamily)
MYVSSMAVKPATIDAYLATVSDNRREALQKLRKTILSILPDAQECISYSMPASRYAGRVVAGFLATSKGYSYFPFSGKTLATLAAEVRTYDQTKSALHFDPKHPLPVALVRKLLRARIAEIGGTGTTRGATRAGQPRPRAPRGRQLDEEVEASSSRSIEGDQAEISRRKRHHNAEGRRSGPAFDRRSRCPSEQPLVLEAARRSASR